MWLLAPVLLGCALLIAAPPAARAEEPFEQVRALHALQDQTVYGDASAHVAQKAVLSDLAAKLEQADAAVWQDPKNVRAAAAFVLSGGRPDVLRKLLKGARADAREGKLLQGALAYAEGRSDAAQELLAALDGRALEPGIAGHVILVQAELASRKDGARALALLNEARLLAPGTLIEEAALRRQVALYAAVGDVGNFQRTAGVYLRRFARSVYAGAFRVQFAGFLVGQDALASGIRAQGLEGMLGGVDAPTRRDLYLAIAKAGVLRGKVELVRFAGGKATELCDKASPDWLRAKLYESAALVATVDVAEGEAGLNAVARSALAKEDAELYDAARGVALAVQHLAAGADQAAPTDVPPLRSVLAAQEAMARVDKLLEEARP
jgi:chemotaxis protein MotC